MSIIDRPQPYTPPYDPEYDAARRAWQAKLSNVDCRSMAYEYRVAMSAHQKHGAPPPDDCLVDAYEEYQRRFGDKSIPHSEFLKKAKMPGKQRKNRSGKGSLSPLYDERGQLR